MNKYLLQLGHCPDVSFSEIVSVCERFSIPLKSLERRGDVCFLDHSSSETIQNLCEELGGTIRAAEVILQEKGPDFSSFAALTPERLCELFLSIQIDRRLTEQKQRPVYGFSLASSLEIHSPRAVGTLLNRTAVLLKEHLREQGVSCRFIQPDAQGRSYCLSGAQVKKNKLLQEGMEILLHAHPQDGLCLASTIWLQHYEEYSHRDYGRPGHDSRSGMLPPKLARILINLVRTKTTATLLDPFCGSGGIVTEAGLMGLQAVGFDKSEKAVEDTKRNWEWLQSNLSLTQGEARAFVGDARNLHTLCEPLFFDACACEPYLGPPTNKPLDPGRFEALSRELIPLYLRALAEIRT
ncbi:MAG: TRM11 family SAM-dependent methyltransferase, partial [Candidatus Hinthialibacter sp.]